MNSLNLLKKKKGYSEIIALARSCRCFLILDKFRKQGFYSPTNNLSKISKLENFQEILDEMKEKLLIEETIVELPLSKTKE